MVTVEVLATKTDGAWWLRIAAQDGAILLLRPHNTLFDAIYSAQLLGVHIDNIDELPLSQYSKVA